MEIIPLYCLEICQYPQAYKYQISRQKMQDPDGLVIIRVQDLDGTMTATFMMWIDLLVQQSKVKLEAITIIFILIHLHCRLQS